MTGEKNTIDYDSGKTSWFDINDKDIITFDNMKSWGKFDFDRALIIAPGSYLKLTQ